MHASPSGAARLTTECQRCVRAVCPVSRRAVSLRGFLHERARPRDDEPCEEDQPGMTTAQTCPARARTVRHRPRRESARTRGAGSTPWLQPVSGPTHAWNCRAPSCSDTLRHSSREQVLDAPGLHVTGQHDVNDRHPKQSEDICPHLVAACFLCAGRVHSAPHKPACVAFGAHAEPWTGASWHAAGCPCRSPPIECGRLATSQQLIRASQCRTRVSGQRSGFCAAH